MKLKRVNWYGFKHKVVYEKFGGDLTFCNSFCVKEEYQPVAVYYAKNPDRAKGHKDYMLLQTYQGGGLVRGMTKEEMDEYRYREGVHCHACDHVIYSVMRHDYRHCPCGSVFVDGGSDYLRWGGKDMTQATVVTIDLIKSKVVKSKAK